MNDLAQKRDFDKWSSLFALEYFSLNVASQKRKKKRPKTKLKLSAKSLNEGTPSENILNISNDSNGAKNET